MVVGVFVFSLLWLVFGLFFLFWGSGIICDFFVCLCMVRISVFELSASEWLKSLGWYLFVAWFFGDCFSLLRDVETLCLKVSVS